MNLKKIVIVFLSVLCINMNAEDSSKTKKAYMVSNAHFDSQWNWDVQRSISEFIPKTLDQNLILLEKYPNYIFNFEGGVKYQWMKEYYPHQYELIKRYINEGRWHVTGSTWDANDPNIPSPESFTRNILYGQHFYRDEFGVSGTDIFLPDCFGFGWTLPTIAAHSGLIGFSTQKLMWRHKGFHNGSKIPFEIGLWQGIDGSKIMMVADAHNYTTKWKDEDLSESEYLKNIINKSPINSVYHYYGTGDTGGAPTIESVRAVEKGVKGDGEIKIISATSDQLFKEYLPYDKHPELPVYNGELLMDVHATGCYTSQAAMKLYNRKNELLADAAERSAVVADWLGGIKYPQSKLTEAWKRVIWHQFHDDLTGTSIPRAYEFSWNDELISLKDFANVLKSSTGAVSRVLDTQVKGTPLVVFNSNAYPVAEVIKIKIKAPKQSNNIKVYNEHNVALPTQILSTDNGEITLLVSANLPSCGYVVYDIRNESNKSNNNLSVTENSLENKIYKLKLNNVGDIVSIYDKISKKELIKDGKSIRLALFKENESFHWPAWEILKKEIDKEPVPITENVKMSIVENGPVRVSICVEKSYGESKFRQYISLTDGGQADRIDIHNELDWQTTNALLKAEFPLNVSNYEATYDLGVGSVKRGNNTDIAYEVYAQQWVDLTDIDGKYGVAIMNDSKYGWDKPNDHTIRLTLLHTPKTRGGYEYQNKQDFGKHHFTISIVGHNNDYQSADIVRKAEILNQPPKAFIAPRHKGNYGKSISFIQSDNENVIVKALKKAEKSDEYVIRLYETSGKSNQKVKLSFMNNIISAKELNGVEDEIAEADFANNNLVFDIKPFGMKTFKFKLSSPANKLNNAVSVNVDLPYNMKASSFNAFRSDTNFDGKGNSYAAELWRENIDFNGVSFKLASNDVPNVVKSNAQTVVLPKGDFNRLYLLVASSMNDVKTSIMIDNSKVEFVVPSYTGFIGQWGHTGHTEAFIKPTDIAFVGTHRHSSIYKKDLPYEFTYMFVVPVDIPKNSQKIVLPEDQRIMLFAATLVKDENNSLLPATDQLGVNLPDTEVNAEALVRKNLLTDKTVIEKTGEFNEREKAIFAIDDNMNTKWCDGSINKPKYMTVDIGKSEVIRGWSVFHAGLEELDYITKEYELLVKLNENDEWKSVDKITDNTAIETDRMLQDPVKARYVRLNITKPEVGS